MLFSARSCRRLSSSHTASSPGFQEWRKKKGRKKVLFVFSCGTVNRAIVAAGEVEAVPKASPSWRVRKGSKSLENVSIVSRKDFPIMDLMLHRFNRDTWLARLNQCGTCNAMCQSSQYHDVFLECNQRSLKTILDFTTFKQFPFKSQNPKTFLKKQAWGRQAKVQTTHYYEEEVPAQYPKSQRWTTSITCIAWLWVISRYHWFKLISYIFIISLYNFILFGFHCSFSHSRSSFPPGVGLRVLIKNLTLPHDSSESCRRPSVNAWSPFVWFHPNM